MLSPRNLFLRGALVGVASVIGACAMRSDATSLPPAHDDATLTLERTSCYGNCPAYSVTVAPDGTVDFVGRLHVQTDHARGHVAPEQRAAIFAALEQADFSSMRNRYTSRGDGCSQVMSDQPSIKITLSEGTDSKSVAFYQGCVGDAADAVRDRITTLANQIDQHLDTARWIGTPAPPGAIEHAVR